jgi:NADPH-dependent ferric siderophore reductase
LRIIDDIINHQDGSMDRLPTERRVQRVRHELRRREVRVARVQLISPGFVGVTFAGDALADFTSDGFDDHVKFMLDGADGLAVRRDYTPRHFDRAQRELTLEFAIHGHGPASDWARQAQVGQHAVIGGPRGSMIVPTDYDWHLLAGDATALPALHRRLEELPPDTRAIALVHVDDAADRRTIETAAHLELRWLASADELIAALQATNLPAGEGYIWCAGEASVIARLRGIVLEEKAHPREAAKLAAYWKRGASDFHDEPAR